MYNEYLPPASSFLGAPPSLSPSSSSSGGISLMKAHSDCWGSWPSLFRTPAAFCLQLCHHTEHVVWWLWVFRGPSEAPYEGLCLAFFMVFLSRLLETFSVYCGGSSVGFDVNVLSMHWLLCFRCPLLHDCQEWPVLAWERWRLWGFNQAYVLTSVRQNLNSVSGAGLQQRRQIDHSFVCKGIRKCQSSFWFQKLLYVFIYFRKHVCFK